LEGQPCKITPRHSQGSCLFEGSQIRQFSASAKTDIDLKFHCTLSVVQRVKLF